jgi:small ligand-binding sensory domain FIST
MPYAASCSQTADTQLALDQVCRDAASQLQGVAPDISFIFASRSHVEEWDKIAASAQAATGSRHILGCTGESIAGGAHEIEKGPALSLWSAVLPGTKIETFHVEFEPTPDGPICSGLPEPPVDAANSADVRSVLLLADPYSCAIDTLISRLADDLPGVPLIGGMASGGAGPEENRLLLNEKGLLSGGVGAILRGGPHVHSIVSQGCRPIGSTFIVTKVENNVILELGGKPALSQLEHTYAHLSEEDRHLIRKGLHVGIAMNEFKQTFSRGDFLISNVLGADRESGAVAIGNIVRMGQTVQFHIRDADTADEDLRQLLATQSPLLAGRTKGALLFSCNGRGTQLFPKPDHDTGVIQQVCGPLPLAGFFAQGELGPVGNRNYIHGFTASIALFEDGPRE